jgi:hypothetical protein
LVSSENTQSLIGSTRKCGEEITRKKKCTPAKATFWVQMSEKTRSRMTSLRSHERHTLKVSKRISKSEEHATATSVVLIYSINTCFT